VYRCTVVRCKVTINVDELLSHLNQQYKILTYYLRYQVAKLFDRPSYVDIFRNFWNTFEEYDHVRFEFESALSLCFMSYSFNFILMCYSHSVRKVAILNRLFRK